MSNSRVKIFSFDSTKIKAEEIEKTINEFLERPEVIVDPQDIILHPDDYTVVYISYFLRKEKNSKPSNKSKKSNSKKFSTKS